MISFGLVGKALRAAVITTGLLMLACLQVQSAIIPSPQTVPEVPFRIVEVEGPQIDLKEQVVRHRAAGVTVEIVGIDRGSFRSGLVRRRVWCRSFWSLVTLPTSG
jgi:hypothetical protein